MQRLSVCTRPSWRTLGPRRNAVGGVVRAEPPAAPTPDEERRLEALEGAIRGKAKASQAAAPAAPVKRIIRDGQIITEQAAPQASTSSSRQGAGKVVWREGDLLPRGWDAMSWPERVNQLLYGERGLLFWTNKAAYASIFLMIGAWIIFRFVGPNLGLYKLNDEIQLPPL